MNHSYLLKRSVAAALAALGLSGASLAAPPFKDSTAQEFARGRILVMPRAGLPQKALDQMLKEHQGKAKKLGQSDIYVVEVPRQTEEIAVARLKNNPHIKIAELDLMAKPAMTPNDTYFANAWHHPKIGTPAAWDISQGAGVTIAILDTGIDNSHPDLAANIVPGWNFYDKNSDTTDVHGHGTVVAGTAAAISNNGIGVASIAGQAKIFPARITDTSGAGWGSAITSALISVADRGIRVANISLTFAGSTMVQSAAQYMKDKGGLVTVAAGNNGLESTITPTTSFIVVTGSVQDDAKLSYATYGDMVKLAAPGGGIWTTWRQGVYDQSAGTSIASPIVAGTIALMMSANPKLSSYEIENLLFSTAVDLGDPGKDIYFGYGRVNAAAAVQAAKNAVPFVDTTAPTVSITNPLSGATVSGLVPVDITAADDVAVARVELRVNGNTVAIDTSAPFAFSWDSTGVPNGMNTLVAHAFDAAGNTAASSSVSVNVANATSTPTADTTPPVVSIVNPVVGNVSGAVTITTNASDNSGAAGISMSIYIDNKLKASGTGSTLSASWNTSKGVRTGNHTIRVDATDKAGNRSSASVTVNVTK